MLKGARTVVVAKGNQASNTHINLDDG
ncbi:hypothethical protein (plasmid) [Ralstonia solanacearum CMR15]|nr:hypothethical protein [Ralstonia solanacearum CMR15]